MLALGGRVVVIGSRGNIEITPRDLMLRDAAIIGMMLWSASEATLMEIHRAIHAGLESGSLNPVISLEMSLAAAAEAHRRLLEPGRPGKMILVP